jgi:hypothetical protein
MRMQRFLLSLVVICSVVTVVRGHASATPESTISAASGDAGNVHIGNSANTSFTIDNTGGTGSPPHELEVAGIIETGAHCAEFAASPTSFTGANNITVADTPETVTVGFTPTARGLRTCTFTLDDDDGDALDETFVASGTGL